MQHRLVFAGKHDSLWMSQPARGLKVEVGFRLGKIWGEQMSIQPLRL